MAQKKEITVVNGGFIHVKYKASKVVYSYHVVKIVSQKNGLLVLHLEDC